MSEYLALLLSERSEVARLRLMVLGLGGVGKSTFCAAATTPKAELPLFHSSLKPLASWDVSMIGEWARGLAAQHGAEWASAASSMLVNGAISGARLSELVVSEVSQELWVADVAVHHDPSEALEALAAAHPALDSPGVKKLARAVGSLLQKGYFSTVGAVKVDGTIALGHLAGADGGDGTRRECSLVDFAGYAPGPLE